MPTAYTDMIDRNPEMTTKQWIMTGLARAFEACVALREDSLNLSEEQIKQRIVESGQQSIQRCQRDLDKAKARAVKLNARTEKEWVNACHEVNAKMEQSNREAIAEAQKMKERHEKVFSELELVFKSKATAFTKNVVKFGMDQLGLVNSGCIPYIQETVTPNAYKFNTIKRNMRDIQYYTEELATTKFRAEERLRLYLTLKKDVDIIL